MRPLIALLIALTPAAHAAEPIRSLDYFQGTWTCNGSFPASGKTIASTMRYDSELQGKALLKHHDDTSPPQMYHAVESWGYDAKASQFHAVILDNFGGARRFDSPGWQGESLTWTAAADVQPAQRFVYVRQDQKTYRVDWQVASNGKDFVVGDTLTCKRQ